MKIWILTKCKIMDTRFLVLNCLGKIRNSVLKKWNKSVELPPAPFMGLGQGEGYKKLVFLTDETKPIDCEDAKGTTTKKS